MWHYYQIFLQHRKPDLPGTITAMLRSHADTLLLNIIQPLLIAQGQAIAQTFFIRYSEGGYHLRLRLRGDQDRITKDFAPQLIAAVNRYLAQHKLGKYGDEICDATETSIRLNEYQPELSKYGGEHGMVLAENHFCLSSQFALRILEDERSLGASRTQWSLAFTDALWACVADTPEARQALIWSYGHYWLKGLPIQEHQSLIQNCFSKGLLAHSKINLLRQTPLYRQWCEQIECHLREWLALEAKGRLTTFMTDYFAQHQAAFDPFPCFVRNPITTLLVVPNFVHMLNNRLGITLGHESQLAYMLFSGLGVNPRASELPLLLEPESLGHSKNG